MRPNSEMTQAEFLGAWLASEEVCGEFFAEIERDRPAALWPLDPTCILPAHIAYPNRSESGVSLLCPYSLCPGEVGAGADQVGVEVVEPLKLRYLEFANSIPPTEDLP
jgi:hypothetical protein